MVEKGSLAKWVNSLRQGVRNLWILQPTNLFVTYAGLIRCIANFGHRRRMKYFLFVYLWMCFIYVTEIPRQSTSCYQEVCSKTVFELVAALWTTIFTETTFINYFDMMEAIILNLLRWDTLLVSWDTLSVRGDTLDKRRIHSKECKTCVAGGFLFIGCIILESDMIPCNSDIIEGYMTLWW